VKKKASDLRYATSCIAHTAVSMHVLTSAGWVLCNLKQLYYHVGQCTSVLVEDGASRACLGRSQAAERCLRGCMPQSSGPVLILEKHHWQLKKPLLLVLEVILSVIHLIKSKDATDSECHPGQMQVRKFEMALELRNDAESRFARHAKP
jgi:hypothetical protein